MTRTLTRTFIAALAGAGALGAVSANAMQISGSDVPHVVSEKASSLALAQDNIGRISVVTDWDGSGRVQGYTAWVNLKSGGTKVVEFDDNGSVKRSYTR